MKKNQSENGKNEKGAAMVMVLLISLLLLTASAGLLMESSLNTQNVSDATAEQQAYNAAESGLQATINVLRGNSEYQKAGTDKINFRKAVTPSISNAAGDTSTSARLSRWLTYNYSSAGNSANDRIKLGTTSNYLFNVVVSDPDDTGQILGFTTKGDFYNPAASSPSWQANAITVGVTTIGYIPKSSGNLDVSSGLKVTDFGSFVISNSSGSTITLPQELRFRLTVQMTAPYNSIRVMRGWIRVKPGTTNALQFDFDSPDYDVRGSIFSITGTDVATDPSIFNLNLNSSFPALPSPKTINGKVTQAEPYRVVIRSFGYGPRGARKQLEATVQKNFFNGLSAPATLTLIGNTTGFHFSPGTSTNVTYSGDDIASTFNIPAIGTTNDANLNTITQEIAANNVKTVPNPPAENVSTEVPFWLESPANLNATLEDLKTVAKASGRYYTSGQSPNGFGNNATSTGITFVDGDVSLSGDGGGILICTGTLTLNGNLSFNGLIIVTGSGGVQRSGGGNGTLQGNTVVAPYNKANLSAGFLSPYYDISGGGTSTIRFDSSSVANGMTAVSNFVLGVAEK